MPIELDYILVKGYMVDSTQFKVEIECMQWIQSQGAWGVGWDTDNIQGYMTDLPTLQNRIRTLLLNRLPSFLEQEGYAFDPLPPIIFANWSTANWNETDPAKHGFIMNKPELADVATSGSYDDLEDLPATQSSVADAVGGAPTDAPADAATDLSGLLATVSTGVLNTSNTKQNAIATKLNAVATSHNALVAVVNTLIARLEAYGAIEE